MRISYNSERNDELTANTRSHQRIEVEVTLICKNQDDEFSKDENKNGEVYEKLVEAENSEI